MLYIDNLVGCWLNICRLRRCHIGGRLGEGLDQVKKDKRCGRKLSAYNSPAVSWEHSEAVLDVTWW